MEVSLGLSRCECCGEFARLVKHHWYQEDLPGVEFHKYICQKCNANLKSSDNHLLPSWDIQLLRLQRIRDEFLEWYIESHPLKFRLFYECSAAGAFYWGARRCGGLDPTLVMNYVG